jgi:predicted transporter
MKSLQEGEGVKNMREFFGSRIGQATAAIAAVVAVLSVPTLAGADVVSSAFSTETTSLTSYIGLGAALVVALLGLGLGVRMLVKWAKRGVSAA